MYTFQWCGFLVVTMSHIFLSEPIQDQVSIRLFSSEHSAAILENVTLICEIQFPFEKPTVIWTRDGDTVLGKGPNGDWAISTRNISQVIRERRTMYRATVVVINVQKTHTYSCMATIGTSSASASIVVRVGPAPTMDITMTPSSKIIQPPGRNRDLTCNSLSAEPLNITWFEQPAYRTIPDKVDPVQIEKCSDGRNNYTLRLKLHPVRKNSSYTCSAVNEFGTKAYTVVVTTIPRKFGDHCQSSLDCGPKHSECIDKICDCPSSKPVFLESEQECYIVANFSQDCAFSEQCRALDNMTYCSSGGYCKCIDESVFSMDLRRCHYPEAEPWADEIFAGIGGTLAFITVANLLMYCLRKRCKGEDEDEETSSKTKRISIRDDGLSSRHSRSNSTRSGKSSVYRKSGTSVGNGEAIQHKIIAQLHAQSLPVPGQRDMVDTRSISSKSSKVSSKSDSSGSNCLSLSTDNTSKIVSACKINKLEPEISVPAEKLRKHSI